MFYSDPPKRAGLAGCAGDHALGHRTPPPRRRRAWPGCGPPSPRRPSACLGRADAVAFLARLDLWFADVHGPLAALYGGRRAGRVDELVDGLLRLALDAAAQRPAALREVDRRREVDQDWYQSPSMIGYVAYVDRFAGTLAGLPDRLDHLAELGVRYLHLMPLLAPREGANDGGYAVRDYRAVDPRLGTMAELEELAGAAARPGHEPVHRPGAQPHRPGAPVGAGLAGRRPGVRRLLHRVPRPDDARPLRADDQRRLPAAGARLVQLGAGGLRRRRRLGVDDVLRLPVGPRLHQPGGVRRRAGHGAVAGQPRRGDLPAGRGAVHVEADGHQLPQPARGARAAAGAARAGQAGRAGHRVQGRGDRRRPTTWCPTWAGTPATGPSASWPTTTS